jgi:hypothetical protein
MRHRHEIASRRARTLLFAFGLLIIPATWAQAQGYGYRGYNVPNLYTGIDPGRVGYGGFSSGGYGGTGLGYPAGYGYNVAPGYYGGYGAYGTPGVYGGYGPSVAYGSSYGYPGSYGVGQSFTYSSSYGLPGAYGSYGNVPNFQLNVGSGYGLGGYGINVGGYPGVTNFGYPAYYGGYYRTNVYRPRFRLFPF